MKRPAKWRPLLVWSGILSPIALLFPLHLWQPALIPAQFDKAGINLPSVQNDKRAAQNLASVCAAAQAAGWDFVAEGKGDLNDTVNLIVVGQAVKDASSPFFGTHFGVPGLTKRQQRRACYYLTIRHGMLVYDPP